MDDSQSYGEQWGYFIKCQFPLYLYREHAYTSFHISLSLFAPCFIPYYIILYYIIIEK